MSEFHPKVLIVDDNDVMRALLRALLRDQQFRVVGEAKNGVQTIESIPRLSPDIICLDVEMPVMNGLEALQEIRRSHPDIAVVMITGNASPENVKEAIQHGAAGFIVKPFNAGKVLDTLTAVAGKIAAQRASKAPEAQEKAAPDEPQAPAAD